MLFNFDEMTTSEFGSYFAIRESLAMPLQTSTVRHVEQAKAMKALQTRHFDEIKSFVDTFRATQPDAILQDPHFRFRVYLVPKVGNAGSSDMAFEFIKFDPQNPEAFKDLEKRVALIREQRVPVAHARFLPKQVVAAVRTRLGKHFSMDVHTRAWRRYQVRPRGFLLTGCSERYCAPDPAHEDYLYTQDWIDFLVNRLADDAEYAAVKAFRG